MDAKQLIDQYVRYRFAYHPPREVIDFINVVWPEVLEKLQEGKADEARGIFREAVVAAIEAARKDRLWEGP